MLVIPSLREGKHLREVLKSALNALGQLDLRFEILVVDDDSRDGTEAIVTAIAREDARVRLLLRRNERAPGHFAWLAEHGRGNSWGDGRGRPASSGNSGVARWIRREGTWPSPAGMRREGEGGGTWVGGRCRLLPLEPPGAAIRPACGRSAVGILSGAPAMRRERGISNVGISFCWRWVRGQVKAVEEVPFASRTAPGRAQQGEREGGMGLPGAAG